MPVDLALANAIASLEMEGLHLSDEGYDLCYKYCNKEISWSDFLRMASELVERTE